MEEAQPEKKSKRGLVIAAAIVLVVVAGVAIFVLGSSDGEKSADQTGGTEENSGKTGNRIGDMAPDFTVKDYDGNEVNLSDFRGTPVFVNFWASWCPFCVDELPLMAEFQQEHEGEYVTLAVDRAEGPERAKEYSDNLGVTDKMNFVIDDSDRVYIQYGGFAMPYSVFIDADGVIRDIKQGPLTRSELENKLDAILN